MHKQRFYFFVGNHSEFEGQIYVIFIKTQLNLSTPNHTKTENKRLRYSLM